MKKIARVLLTVSGLSLFLLFPLSTIHAAPAFTREVGIRISSGTPQAIDSSTGPLRMYFLRDFAVLSATSTDGLVWGEEAGVRLSSSTGGFIGISSITGFSLLKVSTGGYQGVFSDIDSSGTYRIHAATSTDGLAWAVSASTPVVPSSTSTFVGSPKLFKFSNANWRLYFVQNNNGGSDAAHRAIYTSQSTNEGQNWSTATVALADQAGEVTVSTLTNGAVRVLFTAPLASETTNSRLLSGLSDSGATFNDESGVRLSTASTSGALSFPLVIRSSETYRWRVYYAFTMGGSAVPHVFSALTLTPDPQSVSPTSLNRSDPPTTLTVHGEIFSPGMAMTLTKTGQSDVSAASVVRTDDQTMTGVIDPLNKELGVWSLVVTNSDGNAGTLAAGPTLTFSGGSVVLLDNLVRPLTGARTRIEVTIFEAGHVAVQLYSLDGRLVRTLFDGDAPLGTTTLFWDAKNDQGNTVASGAYLLRLEGPKLNSLKKIVVVK